MSDDDYSPYDFLVHVDGNYLCPVCGYDDTFTGDHYGNAGGNVGTGICSCCLFQPGFDDNPLASRNAKPTVMESVIAYRDNWINGGKRWLGGRVKIAPDNWDPNEQLAQLLERAPQLQGS